MNLLTFFFLSGALPKVVIEDAEPYLDYHLTHWIYNFDYCDHIFLRMLLINESQETIRVPGRLGEVPPKEGSRLIVPRLCAIYLHKDKDKSRGMWFTIENPDGDTLNYAGIVAEADPPSPKPSFGFYTLAPGETLVYFVDLSTSYRFKDPGTYRIKRLFYQVGKTPSNLQETDSFFVDVDPAYIFQIRPSDPEITVNARAALKELVQKGELASVISFFFRYKGTNPERVVRQQALCSAGYKSFREQHWKVFVSLVLGQMRSYPVFLILGGGINRIPTEINGQIFPYYLGPEGIALFDSLMIYNETFREATWTIPEVRRNWDEKHKGGQ